MDALLDSISVGGAHMQAAIQSFVAGFATFALHGGVTLAILVIAAWLYGAITPHRELKLIREGNTAAAISYGGAIAALAIPLAFCMATSLNWADIVVWGAVTVLFQLFNLRVVDVILHQLPRRIREGEVAAATMLVSVKLAVSFILAAAVTGAPLARL
ncbi:MAG: DUF350 domain-containing protein [Caulobacterales bacterium]|nr:DUF350 domain-containing protein [Caulobacterales bacterium]